MPDPFAHTSTLVPTTQCRQSLPKQERLCSKKRIEVLFAGGSAHSFSAFPLRAVYMVQESPSPSPVQVLVSVSKRHFRHAVDRNRLKRLVREAYRQNKSLLPTPPQGRSITLAFIWMSNTRANFSVVEAKVRNLLQRLGEIEEMRN